MTVSLPYADAACKMQHKQKCQSWVDIGEEVVRRTIVSGECKNDKLSENTTFSYWRWRMASHCFAILRHLKYF